MKDHKQGNQIKSKLKAPKCDALLMEAPARQDRVGASKLKRGFLGSFWVHLGTFLGSASLLVKDDGIAGSIPDIAMSVTMLQLRRFGQKPSSDIRT